MRRQPLRIAGLVVALSLPAQAADRTLPKIGGKEAVASVNGEAITLDEYRRELADLHASAPEAGQVIPKRDPGELLDRLVNLKLLLQEAGTIGLDELPQFQKTVRAAEKDGLRAMVLDRAVRDVPPPPAGEVEALYRQKAQEYQVASVIFRTREDAARFVEALGETADFLEAGKRWTDDGRALSLEQPSFLKRSEMLPEVVKELEGLEPGKATPPIATRENFAVVKLLDRRVPEDPSAREAARREVWSSKRSDALGSYIDALRARRVKVDTALLQKLNLDADPKSFDTLLEDDRIVARIRGADSIRVRDLAAAVKKSLFHGVQQAGQRARLNKARDKTLEELVTEAAIQAEGKQLGLDRTPQYQTEIKAVREESLFDLFIQKVVDPSVRISEEDVKSFYERHRADFTSPEMLRVESLAFNDLGNAERALDRLRAGADLAWLRVNAENRADAAAIPDSLRFDGRLLTRDSLPKEVQKSLDGATAGDFRVYAEGSGRAHVLVVKDRIPARPAPLDEVRMEVARKVFDEKRNQAVDQWAAKLRQASEVAVFATSEQLRELAME